MYNKTGWMKCMDFVDQNFVFFYLGIGWLTLLSFLGCEKYSFEPRKYKDNIEKLSGK